jgi:hypothetical protein
MGENKRQKYFQSVELGTEIQQCDLVCNSEFEINEFCKTLLTLKMQRRLDFVFLTQIDIFPRPLFAAALTTYRHKVTASIASVHAGVVF